MKNTIKNVIFDLGRVIYNFWPREDLISLGYSEEKANLFMERVYNANVWQEFDRGTYTLSEMLGKICADYPDMAGDFRRVLDDDWTNRVITIMPDNLEFFYDVKRRGFKVYILTNFPEEGFAHCRKRDKFFDEADGIVVSAHEKLNKPDPKIFECILNRYKLVPEETLFIDDMAYNTDAAKAMGIKAIQFVTLEDCKRQFEEYAGK